MAKRKTSKATKGKPERPSFCTGRLPVLGSTLTPRAAQRWLDDKSELWHDLLELATPGADEEERKALGHLAWSLGGMVRACAHAVGTGETVVLESNLDPRVNQCHPDDDSEGLALVIRAAMRVYDQEGADLNAAVAELAGAIVDSNRAAEKVRSARAARERKRNRKPTPVELDQKCDALLEEAERMQKHGEARKAQLLGRQEKLALELAATASDLKRAQHMTYEANRIGHERFGYVDPGPAPKGYRPQENAA